MTRLKNKNQLYTFKYDGDILMYKAKLFFRPLLRFIHFQTSIEIPLNSVLGYRKRSVFCFISYQFYINHYTSSQTRLQPTPLRSCLMLAGKNCRELENVINDLMQRNAMGIPNLAFSHISLSEVQRYYAHIETAQMKRQGKVSRPQTAITKHMPQPIPEAV